MVKVFTGCVSSCATYAALITRSTGTVHCTRHVLPMPHPDCNQNLIICSLGHCQPSLKISRKSIQKFLCKVANTANKQTNKQRQKHNLLGGGNYSNHHTTPQPFHGHFSETTRVRRCQKRTSGLYGARED